ncbi:AEL049Wp [Eremothecium gossypii ATCC 10895]|uniref:Enhancer of mRNA-decapping protein 3 n=1 Tax=Eremothecium gossypii (strain ATCC 10895 / CBS 109.51 / FGSC 9923 / NRRL Y-1056) TaxID=284811 RepID=Q757R1_EREGS|nr:AEL049Wp [Eremothecium gossypii ATCC 10895]AAS52636.2 AEL049Wp [Eremothecium gossypii ATCC 10895]AEY96941.1 FAEL049Wp [Eremothecium gossypii FDAG1]
MSQFQGFKVQVELKDGKVITGTISKCNSKSLTLQDVAFSDGGISQLFKVKASRLRDLKVTGAPKGGKKWLANNAANGSPSNGAQSGGNGGTQSPGSGEEAAADGRSSSSSHGQHSGKDATWEHDDDLERLKNEDFDFQSNLRMFNKQDVFAKLKQQDTVNPSERLVSHNKLRKEKIHFENDEMVIPNAKDDDWDEPGSGSAGSEKQKAAAAPAEYLPITKSINITHLLQQSSKDAPSEDEVLVKLQNVLSPPSRSQSLSKMPGFRTLKTDIAVPLATPVQLLEMERLAEDAFLFPPALALEHSAVHLARFMRQKLGGAARLHTANNNAQPLVVLLASENRCGARALATGRCLAQNSHVRVLAVLAADPHAPGADASFRTQLDMFSRCGGRVVDSVVALSAALEGLNSPPELIVDALQGFDCSLADLVDDAPGAGAARLRTLIAWANAQNCPVWSLDIPSGIDAGSGAHTFEPCVRPDAVVCSSWPLVSLALLDCPELYLCDSAIPHQCYAMRSSLRKFAAVRDVFVTEGVVQLTR